MGALWLDGREMGGGEGHDAHGEMQARFAKIAADGSIGEETLLDSRVCECCSTGMTLAKSGLIAVYRDRSPEEIRDIAFVRQVDGAWTKPAVVAPDNWKITGCPVNGPRIDSHEQFVGAAWFTGSEDKPKVRVAFSPNSGRSWTAPMQIDSGAPIGRVDLLMLEDNTAMVTWVEATGSSAKIVTRRVMNGGWNGPVTTIATTATARASGFPRSASTGDHAYFAWTDPASKKVKVARLALK
jgi:hypothetical protein